MGGMSWRLALLQLRWCDVRISPATYGRVAHTDCILVGAFLWWAPKIQRREITRLEKAGKDLFSFVKQVEHHVAPSKWMMKNAFDTSWDPVVKGRVSWGLE